MKREYDVVIAGGGPAGSTAAILLSRAGFSVCVLEKDRHPRFHIGESILPRTMPLLRELGIDRAVLALPHVAKFGAEFGFGNDPATRTFSFTDGLLPGVPVFNIERSCFDELLLNTARDSGADVLEQCAVKSISRLSEGDIELECAAGPVRGRVLLDASGSSTLVGRELNLRRNFEDPELQKVAYFQHFDGVERLPDRGAGHPAILMCDEGWFWLIALNESTTSVGFVTRPSFVRTLGVPPTRLLQWAIARCPVVRHRMRGATGSNENAVLSDFSYRCRPYCGPGYFLLGDAACFLDPIFSTGVTLAMMSASCAADLSAEMLRGVMRPATAQRRYRRHIECGTRPFWRLIRSYYKHSFRELFVHGTGPLQIPGAIISILAGQVFPRQPWSLRWRHLAFEVFVWLQQYAELSPRRAPFCLAAQPPDELPMVGSGPRPPGVIRRPRGSGGQSAPAAGVQDA
ncbi:MAG: tryptophan 7-halogenase [Phycisphaeraceae bacterium]|nr:tryptophan 7-halogenase [Phycisphaeraceae bacterium]